MNLCSLWNLCEIPAFLCSLWNLCEIPAFLCSLWNLCESLSDHAALCGDGAGDGSEDGDDVVDDGPPLLEVLEHTHFDFKVTQISQIYTDNVFR